MLALSSYNHLSASAQSGAVSANEHIRRTELSHIVSASNSENLTITSTSFDAERESDKSNDPLFENREDDEFVSFKKNLKHTNYSTTLFFAQTQRSFSRFGKNSLLFYNDIFHTLSHRYLVLQVFRI